MSSNEDQGGAGRREVAYRLFASEFDDADFSYSESDEERAPNYVVTPTGARVNRVFLVGVLTEVETVSEDYLRARIVDPSGPFVVYAGQYQPEALAFLESAQPPTFVAVTGKARTYQPDDSDQVYTSVRPESISEVDAATRDRWVVATAEQTLDRVERMAAAKHAGATGDQRQAALVESGVDEGLAAGIPIALERYDTTGDYLSAIRSLALDAARVVAGEQDEVERLSTLPDQGTDASIPSLVETPLDVDVPRASGDDETTATAESEATAASDTADDQRAGTAEASTDRTASESDAGASADPDTEPTATSGTESVAAEGTSEMDDGPAATETAGAESGVESSEVPTETTADEADVTTDTGTTDDIETDAGREPATASEPTTESEPVTESGTPSATSTADTDDDLGDFDPEFELDEDEREEIESEYGTEFQSGTEVDEPGSADIETPDPDELDSEADPSDDGAVGGEPAARVEDGSTTAVDTEPEAATESGPDTESTPDAGSDTGSATESESDAEPDEDVDLEDAVMDAMGDLDDGDGADREAIVAAVVDRTGSEPGVVEDAIQEALMGGRCYEPDDGVLKPI